MHLLREIEELKRRILSLCAVVEESVQKAVTALENRDAALAREVIETDYQIDQLEIQVEEECLKTLALHQPVAVDLRYVIAVLKINNDLERIGDMAVNIAERAETLCQLPEISTPLNIDELSVRTREMLRVSLDALMNNDVKRAQEVLKLEARVNELDRQNHRQVLDAIRAHPDLAEPLITYRAASRHLERIGDYATNIAEDVIYMIEGWIIRHGGRGLSADDADAGAVDRPRGSS
jgi:phosphate transport system protein